MKRLIYIVLFLAVATGYSQNFKDDISVVQFSAPFTKDSEISLKKFKEHNIYNFNINEKKNIFEKEKIKYLPTIILYHNGDEIMRVESGISLKLPDDCEQKILEEIEEIIGNKF